ncbi:zinc finger SWIM domain-containing protein 7-like [Paramacrobiotus metropolitanus]|uniref:zinc finger SWIM domain-containing protein 7-like n=1 Tax=Paramacrobiotus metropolitanus TaxID=2943436 RepID=UPI002445CD96|nr:zinc finger SWIM domain-containing protein 7-like [Paramacrobiotus metropolitanus]
MDEVVRAGDPKCQIGVFRPSFLLDASILTVFDRIEKASCGGQNGKPSVSEENLRLLNETFPDYLEPALQLIDHDAVKTYVGPNGRTVYQLKEAADSKIFLLSTLAFCGCCDFQVAVLERRSLPMCRHILAAELTKRLKPVHPISVSAREIVDLVSCALF